MRSMPPTGNHGSATAKCQDLVLNFLRNRFPETIFDWISGSRGSAWRTPIRALLLSFRHINFMKGSCIGSLVSPTSLAPPPSNGGTRHCQVMAHAKIRWVLEWNVVISSIGASRGVPSETPPKGPDSFISTSKFSKRNRLGSPRPLTRSTPPYGKSWIHHCPVPHPGFPKGGTNPVGGSEVCWYDDFSRKLVCKNKRFWKLRGRVLRVPPWSHQCPLWIDDLNRP